MCLKNFDAAEKTVPEFIDFCKQIELLEGDSSNDNEEKSHTMGRTTCKCNNDKNNHTNKDSGKDDTKYYCMLHGKTKGHNTEECEALKSFAKKCKQDKYPNNSHTKVDYKPKQQEINTMVIEAIKNIRKVKKARKAKDTEVVQAELNAFESISLSNSDGSSKDTVDTNQS